MPIFFSAVVSCVQYLNSIYLNEEHRCTKHMACTIAGKPHSFVLFLLMIVENVNFVKCPLQILLVK
jgi:hypothetical protein